MIMAWVAVDKDGKEAIFSEKPIRALNCFWAVIDADTQIIEPPKGSIKKLIGRELTWDDEPVELE